MLIEKITTKNLTYLSYGRCPYMWAKLLTANAMLRVTEKRVLKLMKKDTSNSSSQKYQGTKTGNPMHNNAKSGIYNLKQKNNNHTHFNIKSSTE